MPPKSDTSLKIANDGNKYLYDIIKYLNKMQQSLNNSLPLHDLKFDSLLNKIDKLGTEVLKFISKMKLIFFKRK